MRGVGGREHRKAMKGEIDLKGIQSAMYTWVRVDGRASSTLFSPSLFCQQTNQCCPFVLLGSSVENGAGRGGNKSKWEKRKRVFPVI